MKSQKVIALLLSTALSISTCVPLGSITALGAEAGTTAQAVEVQEEVSDSAESAEPSQEEEVSTAEETAAADEQEAASGETATEETEDTEVTEDTENVPAEVADDSNESADATETAVPAQEEETAESADNTGSQETDAAASEESAVPAEEPAKNDSAENNTVITAPAQTETVETDAQNSVDDPASVDFSNAIDIKAGESHTVNITEEGGYVLYRFVPEETAAYSFYSDENSGDPRASLYDADKSQIGTGDDEKAYSNFEIKRIFTAGETYYFEAGMFSSTGSYSVHLIKDEFYAEYATVSSRTVSLNDEVTLEVSAFSTSVLSYQWYDIDNEKKIEGATSAAYTLTAQNIGTYRCHVSDENGNYDDLYFFISIDNHINAYGIDEYGNETDWADVYVTPNGSVELNVTVSADDMTALKYEWSDEYGNLIEGAGTTSCTISNVTENRYYYFRVSDQYNNSQSVTFYVQVQNHLNAYFVDEEGDHSTWHTIYVAPNDSAELNVTVSADDMTALKYEWSDEYGNLVEGAGTTSCTISNVTENRYYYFRVSDQYNNSQSVTFDVRVQNNLRAYIVDKYGNQSTWSYINVAPNGSAELNVTVSADDMTALKYEWSDEYGNLVEGAGTTSCTISNVTENRYYYFRVSDQYNNSQSVTFNVYVENNLRAYAVDESGNLSDYSYVDVSPNGSAELNVTVSADDTTALKYEWSDDYGNSIEGAGTTSCTISNVTKNGYYYFRVSDQYNNSQSVEFYIHVQNHLDAYALDKEGDQVSERTIYTELNSSANLDVIVSADDMDHLTYEWYDNNGDLVDGAESTSYTISTVKKAENYRFYVSDQYGNRASVDFRVIPVDYSHAKTINRGESAQVSVNEDSPYVFFKFTPTETAEYILYSSADDGDPYVEVFNDSLEKLFYDDDSGDNLQFRLTETFTAGTTYYIGARAYSMDSSIDYTIHLNKNLDIADAAVTGITNRTYNGKAQTQAPVVKIGSAILKAGTDYTVSYKNHINAGTATVTITGAGSYTGTKTVTFKINKAAQSITVKASAASIAVGKTATVSITGNKGTKSYKSSNTAVATVNTAGKITAKKVGTVTITATSAAAANYNAASKKVTIKVVPAATTSITAANQATGIKLTWKKVAGATGYKVYRGNTLIKTIRSGATVSCTDAKANTNGTKYIFKIIPTASTGNGLARSLTTYRVARPTVSSVKNTAAKKMTVRWKKNAKAKGYQIQYSTNKKFAKGNKTINITKAATVSRVISGLAKGKTYYVRIRTYKTVGKTKYWSAWSAAKTVKIKK